LLSDVRQAIAEFYNLMLGQQQEESKNDEAVSKQLQDQQKSAQESIRKLRDDYEALSSNRFDDSA
jgi:Sec-independent protein translocase protein TatA